VKRQQVPLGAFEWFPYTWKTEPGGLKFIAALEALGFGRSKLS
jgi:hypothetical protein